MSPLLVARVLAFLEGGRDVRQCSLRLPGWRANYNTVLLALVRLKMATYAPWLAAPATDARVRLKDHKVLGAARGTSLVDGGP
jgi:hypothetical protein